MTSSIHVIQHYIDPYVGKVSPKKPAYEMISFNYRGMKVRQQGKIVNFFQQSTNSESKYVSLTIDFYVMLLSNNDQRDIYSISRGPVHLPPVGLSLWYHPLLILQV